MKLFWIAFLSSLSCVAQKDTVPRYLNERLQLTTREHAIFYGVSIRQHDHWRLFAVYSDTTPLLDAWYLDKRLEIKDGPYTVYYPRNRKAQAGYFKKNVRTGSWQWWHENGQLKDSCLVVNGQVSGIWKSWYDNGKQKSIVTYADQLTPEQQQMLMALHGTEYNLYGVKSGMSRSWYPNGGIESEGTYLDDQFDGEWKWFYSNGSPSTVETYINGRLAKLDCFDSTGRPTGDLCSVSKPATLSLHGNYKDYILDNLVWPAEALKNSIEGSVSVHLKVNRYGRLVELQIKSDEQILKDAVAKLFEQMKVWDPAISHNRAVDWEDDMVIPFERSK